MSQRLTPEWTDTLEESLGEYGRKGAEGEMFFGRILTRMGIKFRYFMSDIKKQKNGIDYEADMLGTGKYVSLDVKNNLQDSGKFFVYDWIKKPGTQWVFHVNENTGKIVYYFADDMRDLYSKSKKQQDKNAKLYIVFENPTQYPTFVQTATLKLES